MFIYKFLSIVIFLILFLSCSKEQSQWRNIQRDLESNNFKVTILNVNNKNRVCGNWKLDTTEIKNFLLHSQTVDEVYRSSLDWYDCSIKGNLLSDKVTYTWEINASGNSYIWNDEGYQSTLRCDSIFYNKLNW